MPLVIGQRKGKKKWGLNSNEENHSHLKGSSGQGAAVPEVGLSREKSKMPAAERSQVL